MTPRDVYADVVSFIDGYTADVPPDIGLRMVRSYASNLAEPGESLLDRDNECGLTWVGIDTSQEVAA